jgi:hypothetical protein
VSDAVDTHATDIEALDDAWPLAASLREMAIVILDEPGLWSTYAAAYAGLTLRLPAGIASLFLRSLGDLLHYGSAGEQLATLTLAEIEHCAQSAEARTSIHHLRHRSAHHDAAGELLLREAAAPEHRAHLRQRLQAQLSNDEHSHFVTMESLVSLRRHQPSFTAHLLAQLIEPATPSARQALMVCVVEGYEESFRGRRQHVVPHFDLDPRPKFVPALPHDLDHYGVLICEQAMAETFRPHMAWANARWARWLS